MFSFFVDRVNWRGWYDYRNSWFLSLMIQQIQILVSELRIRQSVKTKDVKSVRMYMTFSIGHNTLCKQEVLIVNYVLIMQIIFQWTMKSAKGVLEVNNIQKYFSLFCL